MTPRQLQLIHTAKRQLKLDDADYRTILRSIGHVESSKDLSNRAFERVMAFLESRGFGGPGAHYWQDKAGRQDTVANEREVRLIYKLAEQQKYPLGALCRRLAHGRTDRPEELETHEAYEVIEALKAIARRQETAGSRQSAAGGTGTVTKRRIPHCEASLFGSTDDPASPGAPLPAAVYQLPTEQGAFAEVAEVSDDIPF